MTLLGDAVTERLIRESRSVKGGGVNRNFQKKTLADMADESRRLQEIEQRRSRSRASSRASSAMSNAVRLPQFVDAAQSVRKAWAKKKLELPACTRGRDRQQGRADVRAQSWPDYQDRPISSGQGPAGLMWGQG